MRARLHPPTPDRVSSDDRGNHQHGDDRQGDLSLSRLDDLLGLPGESLQFVLFQVTTFRSFHTFILLPALAVRNSLCHRSRPVT
jgi:hypothetical protein